MGSGLKGLTNLFAACVMHKWSNTVKFGNVANFMA